jgi:hypothetical protein
MIEAKLAFLISGGTGSGKAMIRRTSYCAAFAASVPVRGSAPHERSITPVTMITR